MAIALTRRSNLAALLAIITPCAAAAEPMLLTRAEMDVVTAAGVVVEVGAQARALGTVASARTDTRTLTRRLADTIEIGAGFAEAQAYACCGRGSSVTADSNAAGGGDVVHDRSFSHVFHGAALSVGGAFQRFAFGYSAALLLTASSDGLLSASELDDALGDLGRSLVGGGQEASDGRLITGFAFAPVYTAGLRWQAARHLSGHEPSSAATYAASQRLTRARQAVSWK